ncbi:centromere protein H [Falco rusticolus]|uniref:centromere protein H n=1 Tax=Falco cherrug TaxID=345164 RepID=UPI0018866C8A|nr:centromere protein H [Falco cherrug]XP_037229561.1 centromere protein H [Falco rusticolus]XP_055647226.1 centromere protein H [Falco peregrinus]
MAASGQLSGAMGSVEDQVDPFFLLCLRDQLKQQLMECGVALHASQGNHLGGATEGKFITCALQDLEDAKASFLNKTLALQRIQLTTALRNKIKENDSGSRVITENISHILTLCKKIMEYQEQAREKEQKLADIKRKRFSLKEAARQKLLQIQSTMKNRKETQSSMEANKTLEKMFKKLQKERQLTSVIQNVFQGIIIGSKVNWAEDPSLKAIVLQLEKNVEFM